MRSVSPTPAPPARTTGRTGVDPGERLWSGVTVAISAVMLAPIVAIMVIALRPSQGVWSHLVQTILPRAVVDTALLMLGVGVITLIVGTATAWLVTMCRFPGRNLFVWLLFLPLAVPTYITAYSYVEILDYSGPVQTLLRELAGWQSARDYWFPEIRSLPGAVFVMSAVLYPYVFLTARATFLAQSVCVLDVSRTLGHGVWKTFYAVAFPLARPALAAGVVLALMEVINDIGAVEFFGVRTLTVTIYSTWLGRGSLGGAAQIALVLLLLVLVLIWAERYSRKQQQFHHMTTRYQPLPSYRLSGGKAVLATLACALPIVIGFLAPAGLLVTYALPDLARTSLSDYLALAGNSFLLSALGALSALVVGTLLVFARRSTHSAFVRGLTRVSSLGYAVPGTVLAIGTLIPLAAFDNAIDGWARASFGISTGLLFSGTIFAVVLTYTVRFTAVSHGAIDAGLAKVSPHLAMAARTLGRTSGAAMREVDLPMIRPALMTAALLVFVDGMKELPATILLRPFNFETLATNVYAYASAERFEDAALAALTIVLVGLAPVALLSRTAELAFRRVASSSVRSK